MTVCKDAENKGTDKIDGDQISPEDLRLGILDGLNAAATEAHNMSGGSFRDFCLGVEVAALQLSQTSPWRITLISLSFEPPDKAGQAATVKVDDIKIEASEAVAKNWNLKGVWAVLYSLCMPRITPFHSDPLFIRRITVAYGKNPCVEYDRDMELGLPLSLDAPYDSKKVQKALDKAFRK